MENRAPLDLLLRALEVGDLPAARDAAQALQRGSLDASRLAAEVLHELRQPLLGVKAHAQFLTEEVGPRESLRALLLQVERMEQIISDFTRLASGRPAPQEPLSLAEPVRAAARSFALHPDAARLSLEVEVQQDARLMGNVRLLEQLVLNLLNNARSATQGPGRVKVVLTREGGRPALYVADWGHGIPESMRERLFEPYATTRLHGTGLGLAVCRRIAQEHHAQLDLAPASVLPEQPPPSTLFRLLFPESATLAQAARPPGASTASGATPEPAAPRRRLLVVDDEQVIRDVLKDLMARECEVLEAATAEQALELLRRGPVEVLVTDKNMPGLSGLELAAEARKQWPGVQVMLMTGYPSVETARQALELGARDYLLKPFDDIRQVRARLRELLAASPEPAPAPEAESRRVYVLDDHPESSRRFAEALELLGLEPQVLAAPPAEPGPRPAAVVVSWELAWAHGRSAMEAGQELARGAPMLVVLEHLSLETALEVLRAGAATCMARPLPELPALARELARVLKLRAA